MKILMLAKGTQQPLDKSLGKETRTEKNTFFVQYKNILIQVKNILIQFKNFPLFIYNFFICEYIDVYFKF